jgi:hypothetical protein
MAATLLSHNRFRELGPHEIALHGRNAFDEQMWKDTLARTITLAAVILFAVSGAWAQGRVLNGRMVGGGTFFTDSDDLSAPPGTRITHNFQLQCDLFKEPNNLHIDVHLPSGESGRFNLTELTFAWCSDDPAMANPKAPFDTYQGAGIGTFNGEAGYCADWQLIDAGERDGSDVVNLMRVWLPSTPGNCAFEAGGFIFSVPLGADHDVIGNHQALKSK